MEQLTLMDRPNATIQRQIAEVQRLREALRTAVRQLAALLEGNGHD